MFFYWLVLAAGFSMGASAASVPGRNGETVSRPQHNVNRETSRKLLIPGTRQTKSFGLSFENLAPCDVSLFLGVGGHDRHNSERFFSGGIWHSSQAPRQSAPRLNLGIGAGYHFAGHNLNSRWQMLESEHAFKSQLRVSLSLRSGSMFSNQVGQFRHYPLPNKGLDHLSIGIVKFNRELAAGDSLFSVSSGQFYRDIQFFKLCKFGHFDKHPLASDCRVSATVCKYAPGRLSIQWISRNSGTTTGGTITGNLRGQHNRGLPHSLQGANL